MILSKAQETDPSIDLDKDLLYRLSTTYWPNFINIHDVWTESYALVEKLCIRMDVAATTLQDILDIGLKYSRAYPWLHTMRGISNGLSRAHQSNVVHGDLKPSNGLPIYKGRD